MNVNSKHNLFCLSNLDFDTNFDVIWNFVVCVWNIFDTIFSSLFRIEHQTKSLFSSYHIQTDCPISDTSKWSFTLQRLNHFEIKKRKHRKKPTLREGKKRQNLNVSFFFIDVISYNVFVLVVVSSLFWLLVGLKQ